jgi:hypothetical protein
MVCAVLTVCGSRGALNLKKWERWFLEAPISPELPHGKNPQAARWPRTHMVPSGSIPGGGGGDVDVTLSQRFRFLVPTSLTVNFCVPL